MRILRPFQVEQDAAIHRALDRTGRALLVSATGTGKSVVIVHVIERRRHLGRAIVFVHREELGLQLYNRIKAETHLTVGIEQAERRVGSSRPDVVIASLPTMIKAERRRAFAPDEFALAVCDESHHLAADSFLEALNYFRCARLGVTATPERADGKSLTPIFGPPVHSYRMARGMREGYLAAAFRRVVVLKDLDMARVRRTGEDFDRKQLEEQLTRAPVVEAMARAILANRGERRSVVFCAGVAHSRALATRLNGLAGVELAVSADGEERAGFAKFAAGEVAVLTNCDLVSEGVDIPDIAFVGLPITKSLTRATQTMGRGTRLADGKDGVLVVEFQGLRSAEQVSTVDVVGVGLSERVRAEAERLLDRQPTLSVLDALDRAGASIGSAIERAPMRPQRTVFDPMAFILSLDGMVLEQPRPGARPATPEQVMTLEREGLRAVGLDIRQAAILMEGIRWRRQRGRCSPMQAVALFAFGMDKEMRADVAARELAKLRAA